MFVDLVGSTALLGVLDPEELREVIRGYTVVYRYADRDPFHHANHHPQHPVVPAIPHAHGFPHRRPAPIHTQHITLPELLPMGIALIRVG